MRFHVEYRAAAIVAVLLLPALLILALPTAADTQDYFPGTETPVKGTVGGAAFPGAIQTSDNSYRTPQEANQGDTGNTDHYPGTETITTGTRAAGTFPDDIQSSNDIRITYREADTSAAPTDLHADTETIVKGTKVSGTFETDVGSDNGVMITYREANQAPADINQKLYPTSETSTYFNTWDTQTGCTSTTHYDCVNEDPNDGDTSYVQTSTGSEKESHHVDDLSIAPGFSDIDVTWEAACRKTAAQQGGQISHLVVVGAEESAGADKEFTCPNSATYTVFTFPMETSPSGDEWTAADINAVECGYVSSTDISPTPRVSMCYLTVVVTYPVDYELEIRYDWTTETCSDTRRLTVNAWHTNSEDVLVQVLDSTETTYTTRLTVTATADGTTLTYDMSSDEWDAGNPNVRFLGNTETGDATQTDLLVDYAVIRCIPAANYQLEVKYDWSGIPAGGTSYVLKIEAHHTSGEDFLIQVLDSTETTWTTRITVTKTTDDNTDQTYTLTSDEFDGGTPNVRFLGNTETGDATQNDFLIDHIRITRNSPAADYEVEVKYSWTGVDTSGNSWTLHVECKRVSNPENLLIQVLDSTETTWTTRYTCNLDTDTLYNTYALTADELDGGTPDIRMVDVDQADEGSQSTWDLDLVKIVRDFTASNSPPTITLYGITPTSGPRSTSFTFFATYTDADNDAPSYMKVETVDIENRSMAQNDTGDTTYTDGKAYNVVDPTLYYCPDVISFFFSASDGVNPGIRTTPSSSFTVTNTVPAITNEGGAPATVVHGNLYSYDFDATDIDVPDCQTFTWSKVSGPAWLTMASGTGILSGTAPDDTTAGGSVTVRVSDGTANDDFTYSVTITNAAPTWTANSPPLTVVHGNPYSYDFDASDSDPNDLVYYTKEAGPTWVSVDQGTGVWSGTAPDDLSQGGSNTIRARDQAIPNGTVDHVWTITITNVAPSFTSGVIASDTVGLEELYQHDYEAADPDALDDEYFTLVTNASWLSVGPTNGTVYGLSPATPGIFYVNVTLRDQAIPNGTEWNNYTLTVAEGGTNPGTGGELIFGVTAAWSAQSFGPEVHFVDDSKSGVGTTSWVWDFGDGTTSTERNPVHTYDVPGLAATYNVTLTVCNERGFCDTVTRRITVWNPVMALGFGLLIGAMFVVLAGSRPRRRRRAQSGR